MKVLYFHQYFTTPRFAGGTRSFEVATRLIKEGHEVLVVCSYDKSFNLPEIKRGVHRGNLDGVEVLAFDIPYSNNMGLLRRCISFFKFALKSLSPVFSENYDVIFSTSTPLTAAIPGVVSKIFHPKRRFIFEVRDLWPELPIAMGMKNPLFIAGMWILEGLGYKFADACVGLAPGIVAGIRRRCSRKKPVEMIPNACDLELFKPSPRGISQLDGISPDDFVAVFTGAHGLANGLYSLLDVAAVLKKRNRNDIKIALIGNGKLKKSLRKRADDEGLGNVKFYEPIPKRSLARILSGADAGLMILDNIPAFYYGTSPNKFFDYLAAGIPVITNYEGWVADIVRENSCGYAVNHSDTEKFADILCDMADKKDSLLNMRSNSRKVAVRDFARDLILDKMMGLFSNTII